MAGAHFENWVSGKQSLRLRLHRSADIGLPALKSTDVKTAMGRLEQLASCGMSKKTTLVQFIFRKRQATSLELLLTGGDRSLQTCNGD